MTQNRDAAAQRRREPEFSQRASSAMFDERDLRAVDDAAARPTSPRRSVPPPRRLRLGGWLGPILSGGLTLAIPAVLITAQVTAEKNRAVEAAIRAEMAVLGPACAKRPELELCICADFETRAQARAYVAAQTRLRGAPPDRRFGLFTDATEDPCAHLPE